MRIKNLSLLAGPAAALLVYGALGESAYEVRVAAAVASWMALWWVFETIAVAATALLPLVLFPLAGLMPLKSASAPYAHPVIFLFLGGFMMAKAMERWRLHERIALLVLQVVGSSPARIIAGFMAVSAFFSMWISNTATVVMLLPIATSVIQSLRVHLETAQGVVHNFSRCLLLGIAYGASVGGVGTLIGSPPNALFAAFMSQELGQTVSFAQWMLMGLPLALFFLPLCWFVLTKWLFPLRVRTIPQYDQQLSQSLQLLGPMNRAEWLVMIVFACVASLWIFRPLLQLDVHDASIAVFGALLMFVLPSGNPEKTRVLDWESAVHIPWEILILFGGGLSLAAGLSQSGATTVIAAQVESWGQLPQWLMIGAVVTLIIFMTEMMSNTATVAMILPALAAIAHAQQIPPMTLLLPATFAASFAFMMPVATPPNAIVFSTGRLRIREMARAGLVLNILGVLTVTIATSLF